MFQGFNVKSEAKYPPFQAYGYPGLQHEKQQFPKCTVIHGKSRRNSRPLANVSAYMYDSQPFTALCTYIKV